MARNTLTRALVDGLRTGATSEASQQQSQKSEKTVQFDLPTPALSPELTRERPRKIDDDEEYEIVNSDENSTGDRRQNRPPRPRKYDEYDDHDVDDHDLHEYRSPPKHSRSNSRSRSDSPSSISSGETVELPPRFDPNGRPVPQRGEDPLADKLEDFLAGRNSAGKMFQKLTGDLLGSGGASGSRSGGRGR